MTRYTAFYFVDVGSARTHIAAWRNSQEGWKIPCGLIDATSNNVTYTPTKPLCQLCGRKTSQLGARTAPGARNR